MNLNSAASATKKGVHKKVLQEKPTKLPTHRIAPALPKKMSPSTMFMAIMPQTVQPGHRVQIKGRVTDGAEQFSINFVNETCANPQNITYHFKWILTHQLIVENNKQNGEWVEHRETDFNALNGTKFALEFAFQDDGIYVYVVPDDGSSASNFITRYEPDHELVDIEAVQVWGDVEKVTQLSFSYA